MPQLSLVSITGMYRHIRPQQTTIGNSSSDREMLLSVGLGSQIHVNFMPSLEMRDYIVSKISLIAEVSCGASQ